MKRFLLGTVLCLCSVFSAFAQMTDSQIIEFIVREQKMGTSQAQIVTRLIQRGVKIDQIRRLRQQYSKHISKSGLDSRADAAVANFDTRLRQNSTGSEDQEVVTAKAGTGTEVYNEGETKYAEIQQDINTEGNSAVEQINEKKVFGRDIFNSKLLSFEPNMNIATPQNYVLGPGDKVIIDIYGASQKSMQLEVSPEGTVTVPNFGPVQVAGLTVASAQARIRSKLGARYSSSELKLTVGQIRSISINVMGEVVVPGTYQLSAFATVFHALYKAGGINKVGTLRNIKVYRNGRQISVIDVYQYILQGRLAGNTRLEDGDVIVVGPYDCLVGISGNVKRPMFFEMRDTESVGTLINYAGGFTGDAYTKSVRLVRKTGERYEVFNVEEFDMNTFKVNDGDVLTVDGILNRFENMVEIKGAVFRPGQFQLGKDVTSVRSLINAAEGTTEDAFTDHAILHRLRADRSLEIIAVDVKGIMNGTAVDIPLQNEDVLFVPTQSDRLAERTVTIHGEVMSPGVYEYSANATVEDLIIQAGGLTDAASMAKVDVSRRIIDPKALAAGRQIAQTFSFALKDGFVVGGEPGFILEPYDEVYVRRSPTYRPQRNVRVTGELQFPGNHTLTSKNQRLTDIVKAAGGFTSDAYIKGARLERRMTPAEKKFRDQQIMKVRASQNLTAEDSLSLAKFNMADTYTVGINLEKAMENPGSDYDVVVREGDNLIVPEYDNTVTISGEVMFPNTVAYSPKKNYKWYVNQAGGVGMKGKRSKAYIIYPNGTMAQVKRNTKIEPGSEIVVPVKVRRDTSSLTQWISIGTSIASLGVMVAYLVNAMKK